MISETHAAHLIENTDHANCAECSADRERSFVRTQWPGYRFIHEYLLWARAGFNNKGVTTWWAGDRLTADQFRKEFIVALHNRIYLRMKPPKGRKYASCYLERLRQWKFPGAKVDAAYLRRFAKKGASAL
jgi:hypothetical protein